MSSIDKPLPSDSPNVSLTLRMIMNGKEVGSIIGKGGEIINSIRDESGAKIHISDGSCPERIVTVTGPTDSIFKAYKLICKNLEDEDGKESRSSDRSGGRGPLTLRLVVPASQCGSLIGKGGSKIKEIREVTGASVLVASEMLPGSTERSVTVSGSHDSVTQCVYHICSVMLECPPKGTTLQYQPGRAAAFGGAGILGAAGAKGDGRGPPNPLAGLLGLGVGGTSTLAAIASIAGSQIRRHDRDRDDRDRETTYQMFVPNELIGSIIGKGGSKIAEIRQISGAMIRISKSDDPDSSPSVERQIQITGNPDSVALAKSLINMSLDLQKASLEGRDQNDDEDNRRRERRDGREDRRYRDRGAVHDLGLAGLLAKPDVLAAVSTLAQLGTLSGGVFGGLGQLGGFSRGGRSSYGGGSGRARDDDRRDNKRSKFAPY